MSFNSLFTALTDMSIAAEQIEQSAAVAEVLDAHLDALCLGLDRTQAGNYYAGATMVVLQETIARATKEADDLAALTRATLEDSGIRWSCEQKFAPIGDIGRHIAALGRFSDLALLPRPLGKDRKSELEGVFDGLLFDAQVPVLVMPDGMRMESIPKRVSIGWNGGDECLSAVRAALPFVREAEVVRVVVVDPPSRGFESADPGVMIAQFLARHGANVEIDVQAKSLPHVSEVLLRHASDTQTELLVMGAYGHSRLREALLGGATREILETATLPVLMAR